MKDVAMDTEAFRSSILRRTKARIRRAGFDVTRVTPARFVGEATPDVAALDSDGDRLAELRARYRTAHPDVVVRSVWDEDRVSSHTYVDEERFRAESMYVWQYVNAESSVRVREAEYQYHVYLSYLRRRDDQGLLDQVEEDGAFGAPVFAFPGLPAVSRDLLDSVNEILYLHRRLGVLEADQLRVFDIGAGYGRLAHRSAQLIPGLTDYACTDAIPESTYVCERYLDVRGVRPPCRIVELPDVEDELVPGRFDLAVNVHSFSEMPASAIRFWIDRVSAAEVPHLFVIPNAPTTIRSYEPDGRRIDMASYIRSKGYELTDVRPIIEDPAARELFGVDDHFHLFEFVG